jgi:hypothetical protein
MESQTVVDHTEVDGNGFLIGGIDNESHPMDELWAEIRSLERRANSRDREALTLNESGEGARIYLLRLESRGLRNQAQRLRKQRADSMAGELGNRIDSQVFVPVLPSVFSHNVGEIKAMCSGVQTVRGNGL